MEILSRTFKNIEKGDVSTMKRIKMILTNSFGPDVRVYKEAKYLISKGFDVEILCWDRENEYRNKDVEEIDGISIKRFNPYAKYGSGLKQVKAFIEFINEIKKYLLKKEFDYIHCHDLDGTLTGYIANQNKSCLIFDMHEFYEVQGKKQRIRFIIRLIVKFLQSKSNHIIYVNELQTTVMKESDKKKLIYLPNYPDVTNYINSDKRYSKQLRISYIGAVRQYSELKNLMDACKKIDNVEINIHGTGVAYNNLNMIKMDYPNVNITGKYNFSESAKLYSEADILYALYPITSIQYRTSYPVKLFEAIITKTPLIVSKGTVLEDFVLNHDIGFIVDGSNVEEIRELVNYINDHKYVLEEKMENLEKIQYDYSWEEVVKNLDKIYD